MLGERSMAKVNILVIGEKPPGVAFLRFVLRESGYNLLLATATDALPLSAADGHPAPVGGAGQGGPGALPASPRGPLDRHHPLTCAPWRRTPIERARCA